MKGDGIAATLQAHLFQWYTAARACRADAGSVALCATIIIRAGPTRVRVYIDG
jgi:hypothetical protein